MNGSHSRYCPHVSALAKARCHLTREHGQGTLDYCFSHHVCATATSRHSSISCSYALDSTPSVRAVMLKAQLVAVEFSLWVSPFDFWTSDTVSGKRRTSLVTQT